MIGKSISITLSHVDGYVICLGVIENIGNVRAEGSLQEIIQGLYIDVEATSKVLDA